MRSEATVLDQTIRVILAASLLGFAVVKLVYGYRHGLEIGPTIYYTATGVEFAAALLLLSRRFLMGATLTAGFFAIAIGYSWWSGMTSCGCLGPVRLSSHHYRMIGATIGLLATLLVFRQLPTPAPKLS